jgi:putative transposase
VEAVIAETLPPLEEVTSTKKACELLGANRSTVLRRRQPPVLGPPAPRPEPANKLTEAERQKVLSVLRSPEYRDLAPAQVWAQLVDDGIYLCSIRTMYRLLAVVGENRERRRQRTHPARKKPELIARAPNEVWSWDITKLQGPERGVYYELFVIIDIYSRYVVAWTVAAAETGELAEAFIADAIDSQGVDRNQLTLHAEVGSAPSPMPARFCATFFDHYNHVHRHAGIGLHTPASVHYGTANEIRAGQADTLTAAYQAKPARFRHRPPTPPKLPEVAWINEPNREALIQSA